MKCCYENSLALCPDVSEFADLGSSARLTGTSDHFKLKRLHCVMGAAALVNPSLATQFRIAPDTPRRYTNTKEKEWGPQPVALRISFLNFGYLARRPLSASERLQ